MRTATLPRPWQRSRRVLLTAMSALFSSQHSDGLCRVRDSERITRKRSLSLSLAPELTAEICEERCIGRPEAFDELDGAGTLKSILQKGVALFLWSSVLTIFAARGCRRSVCVLPVVACENSKGGLYWHVRHHHCAERHFVCSGTKQKRAIMSMFQCDLYRGPLWFHRPCPMQQISLEPNAQRGPVLADDHGTGASFEDSAVHTPPVDHLVGSQPAHTHTSLEDRLERLFAQGRDLASTLVRPVENIDVVGIVAATETLKRYILTFGTLLAEHTDYAPGSLGSPCSVPPTSFRLHPCGGGQLPVGPRR